MDRKVYLDFQDGSGYRDVSSLVKFDSLNITLQAFSDNFHFAQNEASFDIIYDSVIYPLLRYATKDIICKILDVYDESLITAEDGHFLITEAGFYLAREIGGFIPWFYGRISPTKTRSYNGILNNTIWTIQVEDDSRQLDKPVGDICYTNFTVMNPNDPTTSIVHQLAYLAGFTLAQIGNVTISTSISKFAPNNENDSILTMLDTLLFEYGYVLNFDVDGKLTPIKWINESVAEYNFTESNMCREVSVEDTVKDFYGAKLVWYELTQAVTTSGNRNILLYMDDNCPYEQGQGWAGYSIPAGYTYPPETNITDPTISGNSVVYQEYSEVATTYWTNYAIVNKLDYNYKAFDSDFSAIVATSDQWVDWSAESGIVMTVSGFGNKKARIEYDNPTGDAKKLYYNNIYGQVWYKSAERLLIVDNTTISGQKLDEYVSSWIFDSTTASGLVTYLAAQHNVGNTYYKIISEADATIGAVANVTMGDGTNQDCLIMSKTWNEKEELYNYKLRARNADRGTLTSQGYKTASILGDQEAIVSELYPSNVAVSANIDGSSPDLTNAYADMYIYRGGKDVTYDWIYNAVPTGVMGAFGSGGYANRYTISEFVSDATKHGNVLITASRAGYAAQSFNFTIDKICQSDAASSAQLALISGLANSAYDLADGKIVSYWQASAPASGMNTGDLWFDTDAGNIQYIYTTSGWTIARDTGIAQAINDAATASGLADSKAIVYYQASQPTVSGSTYQGDLWVDTDDNNKVYAYSGSGWVLAQDWYTANQNAIAASGLAATKITIGWKPTWLTEFTVPSTVDGVLALLEDVPTTSGLHYGESYMGHRSGSGWDTYIGADGKFKFSGDASNYIQWDGSYLDLRGRFRLVETLGTPATGGLFIGADKMGYYNGAGWKTYMDSSGRFYLTSSGTDSLSWADGVLTTIGDFKLGGAGHYFENSDGKIRITPDATINTFGEGLLISSYDQTSTTLSGGLMFSQSVCTSGYGAWDTAGVYSILKRYSTDWDDYPIVEMVNGIYPGSTHSMWTVNVAESADIYSRIFVHSDGHITLYAFEGSYPDNAIYEFYGDHFAGQGEDLGSASALWNNVWATKFLSATITVTSTSWATWFTPELGESGLISYNDGADGGDYITLVAYSRGSGGTRINNIIGTGAVVQLSGTAIQIKAYSASYDMVFNRLRLQ